MRISRHLVWTVASMIGVIVLIVCFLVMTATSDSKPTVSIKFDGFTNDPSGVQLATFKITNDGRSRVYRWGLYQMEGADSALTSPTVAPAGRYLESGGTELLTLECPSHINLWRGLFHFSEDGVRLRLGQALLKVRGEGLPVRSYQFQSDWID